MALNKQGGKASVWPLEAVKAFETLKNAFASAPIAYSRIGYRTPINVG